MSGFSQDPLRTASPALDVQRALQVAEHEVALAIGDVVERHGAERLDERHAVGREELVLDAAVHDADVARTELARLVADRHRDRAVEDQHHLLGVLVAVSCDRRPGRIRDATEEDLVAGDRLEPHAVEDGPGLPVDEAAEGRVGHAYLTGG